MKLRAHEELTVRPGEGIGPFNLSMTRDDIVRAAFEEGEGDEDALRSSGFSFKFAGDGRCVEVEVILELWKGPITLGGKDLTILNVVETDLLFAELGPLAWSYAYCSPETGVGAVCWERTDSVYYAVSVMPTQPRPRG